MTMQCALYSWFRNMPHHRLYILVSLIVNTNCQIAGSVKFVKIALFIAIAIYLEVLRLTVEWKNQGVGSSRNRHLYYHQG